MDAVSDHLASVRKIVAGIRQDRGFHASMRSILGAMQAAPACLRPHILVLDPELRTLRLFLPDSPSHDAGTIDTPGAGITGEVFASGQAVIVERILDNPVFVCKFFKRSKEEMASLSFISVPVLASGDRCLGAVSMDTPLAPMPELRRRCEYLETVAGLVALLSDIAERDARRRSAALPLGPSPLDHMFVATSHAMQAALEAAARAGVTDSPVLVTGEFGTGKALLATTIHAIGPRRDLPLRTLDLRGTSEDVERRLFGYKRGAFPGADCTSKGLLELTRSSTLFIPGVDTLPTEIQDRLADAFVEQRFRRIGDTLPIDLDVRLVCASDQSLETLARSGRFSARFLDVIGQTTIPLPSLRERRDDIVPLALEFLKQTPNAKGRPVEYVSAQAQNALVSYAWPGNVHELRMVLDKAARRCLGDTLTPADLPPEFRPPASPPPANDSFTEAVERFEKDLITNALRAANGNKLQAARDLNASYRIINYKIKKYGIAPRRLADGD